MSWKAHLISHAAAVAAGVATTLVVAGAPEVDAIPMPRDRNVSVELQAGAASTLESFLVAQLCPQVVAAFGGTCTTADVFRTFGVDLQWEDDGEGGGAWTANSHVRKAGDWVADP